MKIFKLLFFSLLHTYFFAQNDLNFIDNNINSALEKSQIENKLIFIDFYTTWCAPCKRMDKEVFTDYTIQTFFNENFINLKINAETELGKKISPKYEVEAFPTFVFIDSEEKMIYKIVGYQK
ncbi:thioredoxin family protein [Flavobacterium piscinae]|nr:thioredoxin fold domain-containing protein [Flavobacterium piscinae]MBC8884079.1 thioredoxin family protein [Flavobacterium piscinae]